MSYSHHKDDEGYLDSIETSLALLEQKNLIRIWSDRNIIPGQSISEKIKDAMNETSIVLFLFSPDFINSEWCCKEWKMAKDSKKSHRVPVIVRDCAWKDYLGEDDVQALPKDGRSIRDFENEGNIDKATQQVYEGVKKITDEIRRSFTGAEEDMTSASAHSIIETSAAHSADKHDNEKSPSLNIQHWSPHDIMRALLFNGDSHLAQANIDIAKAYFESVVIVSECSSNYEIDNMEWQKYIVTAYMSLGIIYTQEWNGAASRRSYKRMLKAIERLEPHDFSLRWEIMRIVAYISIAGSYRLDGNKAAVLREYKRIVRITEEMYVQNPLDEDIKVYLIFAKFSLGNLNLEQDNEQESIKQFQSMSNIAEHWEPQAGNEAPWRFATLVKLYELTSDGKWRMKAIEEGDALIAREELSAEEQALLETLRHR